MDFTVVGRYNYRYAVNAFIKLDESIHGVTVVIPTNDREIPGSIPRRYNLQIKITSLRLRSRQWRTSADLVHRRVIALPNAQLWDLQETDTGQTEKKLSMCKHEKI